MALLNRFSKLNDRAETGIFTFIVTKSVTRDFHRDATTKDFCFGYHRWAISFQRPSEKVLGVHLLLRNASPNTACVVDFSLALLNRQHFSQNQVYTKRQAKFTITNPMQGVSRWIQMSDLIDRRFSNETGEFLFELSLSNMTTIFECDIQLNPTTLSQYKAMLKGAGEQAPSAAGQSAKGGAPAKRAAELINLETNYFTFGAFDWSLTIVPLVLAGGRRAQEAQQERQQADSSSCSASSSSSNNNLLGGSKSAPIKGKQRSSSSLSISSLSSVAAPAPAQAEPVCRVYLNRLNGFDCLCRVRYRVILGHHQLNGLHPAEFVDSRALDQVSDSAGRIRGHQFRRTNILKLISLRSAAQPQPAPAGPAHSSKAGPQPAAASQQASLDLRVHIEMYCANTISEARVPLQRKASEPQVSNCSDRNKQAWCVECDAESERLRLKLFFMDLQSVPRNHIRYISWIAYVVRRDSRGSPKESRPVLNSPHSNYYLQDGIDMGALMDTHVPVKELSDPQNSYLDANNLIVHIEWVDSLLLFSHLYNNYDSLATIQRHQISRELNALQEEYAHIERKYLNARKSLNQLLADSTGQSQQQQQHQQSSYSPPDDTPPSEKATPSGSKSSSRAGSLQAEQQQHQQLYKYRSSLKQQQQQHQQELLQANDSPLKHRAANPEAQSWEGVAAYPKGEPMSPEERLKLSSSTPPSSAALNMQHQQQHYHHYQLQQRLSDSPQRACLGQSMVRRRLPAQPKAGGQVDVIERRESLNNLQYLPLPLPMSNEKMATLNQDNNKQLHPIASNSSQQLAASLCAATPQMAAIMSRQRHSVHSLAEQQDRDRERDREKQQIEAKMERNCQGAAINLLIKETNNQLINQVEMEQVDGYRHGAQLNSLQNPMRLLNSSVGQLHRPLHHRSSISQHQQQITPNQPPNAPYPPLYLAQPAGLSAPEEAERAYALSGADASAKEAELELELEMESLYLSAGGADRLLHEHYADGAPVSDGSGQFEHYADL